jgi:hypothetical protein
MSTYFPEARWGKMEKTRWNARFLAILVLAVLAVADYAHEVLSQFGIYSTLYHGHPYYARESLDTLFPGVCSEKRLIRT